MTQTCAICGKGSNMAWRLVKLRGKYNPTVKRKQKPNLQWTRLPAGRQGLTLAKAGFVAGTRIKACTKCIKALAKKK